MSLIQDVDQAIAWSQERLQQIVTQDTWVIPQSGGKDSRATAQVALTLIEQGRLPAPRRLVFYMADTLMEFQLFMSQGRAGLAELVNKSQALGIETHSFVTLPLPQDDFWVRIIGYGFIPPTEEMRTCTDKLKITPARKVLRNNGWASAPLLLGVRRGESDRRDKRILSCTTTGECGPDYLYLSLSRKAATAQQAITPILAWRACAVWDFLMLVAPGYGFDNRFLASLYGPNGDLRYGCWTCPLIYQDRTAEYLALSDPKVLELLRFANTIFRREGAAWQPENRELFIKQGQVTDGLLSLEFCRRLYAWLLDFEARWAYPLLNERQKGMIRAIWAWRERLPEAQAGHGGQLPLFEAGCSLGSVIPLRPAERRFPTQLPLLTEMET